LLINCPDRKHGNKIIYHVHEATKVNDVARSVLGIYVVVENRQAYHQDYVVDMEGIISKKPISILIDLSSNLSYVSPQVIEPCAL
jgi:hypothetical protein